MQLPQRRFRARRARGALAALFAMAALPAGPAAGGDAGRASEPGAYCPLPEKGEVPRCLDPARETYGSFFEALDDESVGDASVSAVEEAVARGSAGPHAYLALSSLAYGYYRLAQRAEATAGDDPPLQARLHRWNALLARAYAESPGDTRYREAVRRAAEELRERAPIALPCHDARGEESECNATESVLRSFDATTRRVGIRGALERLLLRIFGGDETS